MVSALNQFTLQSWNPHFRGEKHACAEKFIRSLVEKYGRHTVYTDGGTLV